MSIYTLKDGTDLKVVLGPGSAGQFSYELDSVINMATGEEVYGEEISELLKYYECELKQQWEDSIRR